MSNKIKITVDSDEWYPVYTLYRSREGAKYYLELEEETVLEIEKIQKQFDELQSKLREISKREYIKAKEINNEQ